MSRIDENIGSVLICPICQQPLHKYREEKRFCCDKNHSYDIAKQGYTNLLMSNQKKSNHPGESKEMIRIRRDFLDKGYYQLVSDALSRIALKYLSRNQQVVLDLGCGEGYYLNRLEDQAKTEKRKLSFYGLDISKDALRLASVRNKEIEWVVASSFLTPFKDNSIDMLMSVFSPISDSECERLLSNEGHFIRVLPNADHLIELREVIYDQLEERREGKIESEKLHCVHEEKIKYEILLEQEDIINLLQMTPHYWKTSAENKNKVNAIEQMNITIDMNISVFRRPDSHEPKS